MDYSYIGVGRVYMREVGAAAGLVEVGNCSALSFAISEETKELKDYTQGGGGVYNAISRVSAVDMSLTMHDLSPENLARALYGSASPIAAGAVVGEAHTAYKGAFVPFDFIADTSVAPVVKTGAVTHVAGTDYEVRPGGIFIIVAGAILDADAITIDYTKAAGNVVEALTASGKEYELFFAGLNEARSGKETTVEAYRVKIGAAKNIGLIGEDYAALEVTGKLLKDTTKTGAGVSQYFKAAVEA